MFDKNCPCPTARQLTGIMSTIDTSISNLADKPPVMFWGKHRFKSHMISTVQAWCITNNFIMYRRFDENRRRSSALVAELRLFST